MKHSKPSASISVNFEEDEVAERREEDSKLKRQHQEFQRTLQDVHTRHEKEVNQLREENEQLLNKIKVLQKILDSK